MTLYDFEALDDPNIVRGQQVQHPALDRNETVGWTGTWAGGICYLSPRSREEHFFCNQQGYAVSKSVIENTLLPGMETVDTVFVAEKETEVLFEFSLDQFQEGYVLDFDGYDRQKLVPVADARRTWEKNEVTIK